MTTVCEDKAELWLCYSRVSGGERLVVMIRQIQIQLQIQKYNYKIANTKPGSGYVTHVYPVEKGFSPIATLSCWSLMFLATHKIKTCTDGWMEKDESYTNHHLIQYSVALESAKAGENLH